MLASTPAALAAPWLILAALLTGVAAAAATRRTRPAAHQAATAVAAHQAATTRKWITVCLSISGAILAWLLAVFLPGPARIAGAHYPVYYLALAVLFGASFRMPRTVGVILLAVGVGCAATLYLLTRALSPLTEETELARFVVYAAGEEAVDIELLSPGRAASYVRLEGDSVSPVIRIAVFDERWPVIGWQTWYRFDGLAGERGEPFRLAREPGVSEELYRWFEANADGLPGVRLVAAPGAALSAVSDLRVLRTYALRLRTDGGFVLQEVTPRGPPGD